MPVSLRFQIRPYLLALAAAMLMAGLHYAVFLQWQVRAPFLVFVPLVLACALRFGYGPALLVAAAAFVNGYFYLYTNATPMLALLSGSFAPIAFGLIAILAIFAGGRLRSVSLGASETLQRLKIVQQHAGVGLFEIDLDLQSVYVSEAMWTLLGREQPMRRNDEGVPLEEWRNFLRIAGMRGTDRTVAPHDGLNSYEHECRVHLADGKVRWLLSRVNVERDDRGVPLRLQCAALDITERKQADTALKRTRQEVSQQLSDFRRLHALSTELLESPDLSSQLAAILDTLAEFHDTHQGIISLYDEKRGGLVLHTSLGFSESGKHSLEFVAAGEGASGLACSERKRIIVDDTRTAPCFREYQHLAEHEGFRAVHSTPLISVSGKLMGVISIHVPQPFMPDEREVMLSDLCARKAAMLIERAHARRLADDVEQRFRTVVDTAALGFCLFEPVCKETGDTPEFICTYANATALSYFERTSEGMQSGDWVGGDIVEACRAVPHMDQPVTFEMRVPGNGRRLRAVASPADGKAAIWFRDVTIEKNQQETLLVADRRKDEFLATLAHELRNPLAPIRHAAYIISRVEADAGQKERAAAVIERQVDTMARLLEDLLEVARITSGKFELKKERITVSSVLETALETVRPAMDARRHRLAVEVPNPEVMIEADPLRLSQILCNLLGNAAKFTVEGGDIRLRVMIEEGGSVFEVSDNGIGFDADAAAGMFELFAQNGQRGGGLGIGLALAKGLAELHGGRIEAESEGPGKGSRFRVFLPWAMEQAAAVDEMKPSLFSQTSAFKKVLVADDNRDAAEMLAEMLILQGKQVHVTFDGKQAMDAFEHFSPDVTLLDLSIAKADDFALTRRMRARKAPHAKLIAVSGRGQAKDKQAAIDAGFDQHLTKPVDPQLLRELLQ